MPLFQDLPQDAYREQLRKHIAAIDGRRPQDGHSERGFSVCPHPDCRAVQTYCECRSLNDATYCALCHRPKRPTEQPAPVANAGPCIQDLVIADVQARKEVGRARYGTVLQPFNGRDALRDAYEEALDLCQYLKQALVERAHLKSVGEPDSSMANDAAIVEHPLKTTYD